MAVGPLEHGVTPLQGRGRRQRDDPGERVRQLGVGPVQQMAQDPAATPEERVHLGLTFVHQPLGPLHGGTARARARAPAPRGPAARVRSAGPGPELLYALQLLAHVRDDLLGRVRGRGGAQIGDQVQQRGVRLMADRGDHRRTAGGHGPHQLLVGERQQILDAAAAPGHHDHVDLVQRVQLLDRLHHLGDRVHPLHGGVADLEAHGRPAAAGVLQDVPLGGGGPPADEPDELREGKGSGFFRSSAKRPSAASDFLSCSSRTSSSPMPTGRMSVARSDSCPRARTTRASRGRRRARPPSPRRRSGRRPAGSR
ncbi:hypothetical protein SBADM41S_03762 [Streptomyces badius]